MRLVQHRSILRRVRIVTASGLLAGVVGCASPSAPTPETADGLASDLAYCVNQLNQYRASIGRPALAESVALEAFAAEAAAHDGALHVAHDLFATTNGRNTAAAETEILWWKDAAVRTVIRDGLAQMWKVGPGGEHYDIISGPYASVGCGVFVNGSEVTVTQDFR